MSANLSATKNGFECASPLLLSLTLAGLLVMTFPNRASAATRQTSPVESARHQAEQLSLVQKHDEAWEILRAARAHASPGDTAYWQLYGDQAWDRGDKPEAMMAYRTVWEAGSINGLAMERLIQHYNANGEPKLAIAIGEQGYQRLAEVRWLLLAMDAASQASLWDKLRALSAQAKNDEAKFRSSEMYWLLEAHIANHDGQKERTRGAYKQALALNPTSVPTRAQVLWFEIDGGDKQQLGDHLAQWQDDAQAKPAYWSAYAVALLQLNRVDESLVWFNKQAREKPDDFLWQLSYISKLSQAGQPEQQERLRRAIVLRLKDRLALVNDMPKPDGKVVLLAYASMVRDFDGAAAGDQVLQDTLGRGYTDADVYESLVASSLAQKNFEAANGWLARAEADHQKLPAYQLLAVAMARHDPQAIEQVLHQREQDLSTPDRVTALRQLGHNQLALSLTEKSLLEAEDESRELLRQHQEQLKVQLARRVEAGYEARNLSDLKIRRSEVAASIPHVKGRTTVRLAHNALSSDSPNLRVSGFHGEDDLSLLTELPVTDNPMRVTLGRNQRSDKSLTYGRFEWIHVLSARFNTRLDVSFNGLTEETSALRAIGSKDKVSLGISGNLTDLTYARAEMARQNFNTRNGDALGHGYRIEGEMGTTVFKSISAWQVRISGSSERNRVADRLPAYLIGPVLPAFQTIEGVLANRFSTLGIGSTFKFGQLEGRERRIHGLIDGWVGKQWPASERAYSLRAALNIPVLSAGQVRAEAFYTNVQGGVSSAANRGVGVWYRHEF